MNKKTNKKKVVRGYFLIELKVNRKMVTFLAIVITLMAMIAAAIMANSLASERARRFDIINAVCREEVE